LALRSLDQQAEGRCAQGERDRGVPRRQSSLTSAGALFFGLSSNWRALATQLQCCAFGAKWARRFVDPIHAPFTERRGHLDRRRGRGGGWLAISAHPCSSGS
jgi:hypothetical protein